ncbi:MAG: preprotein translocase subunit SecA, partial [bacterium]|nr:preprotein translocase subunit SecA [bacterium]
RSARQGDPGETQFFVSLEDSLMRIFASDTIKTMMGRFGIAEDEPIENRLITRSLESAQTKIEGFHFDSRKHVLEYDDVLSHQRTIIYERRRKALVGLPEVLDELLETVSLGDEATTALIAEKKEKMGNDLFYQNIRRLILQTIDLFWVDHLEQMDYLRGSVNLRAYGQRDPLVEYKKEGLKLFKEMEVNMFNEIARLLPHIDAGMLAQEESKNLEEVHQSAESITGGEKSGNVVTESGSIRNDNKIGRNDPCPCGAVNAETRKVYKWKQCGMINASHHHKT